jgi:hypothetical protein
MKRLLLCLTALVALSGCGYAAAHQEPLGSGAPASAPATAPAATLATPVAVTQAAIAPRTVSPSVPTRFRVGDIKAPVVPVVLTGATLTPPADPRVLGWWGKRAGARHGTTLLTGHTVHNGGGTFDSLEDTPVGARAHLNGHSYRVTSVQVIPKRDLVRRAPALFAPTGRPKLVLVTCEGYNPATGHYASNVVVTAIPERALSSGRR